MIRLQKVWIGVGDNATTINFILSPYLLISATLNVPNPEALLHYFLANGWGMEKTQTVTDNKTVNWFGFSYKKKPQKSKYTQKHLL